MISSISGVLASLPSQSEKAPLNPALLTLPIAAEIIALAVLPSLHMRIQRRGASSTIAKLQKFLLLTVAFPVIIAPCLYILLYTTTPESWMSFGIASAAVFVIFQSFDLLLWSWWWAPAVPAQKLFYRTDRMGWLRCTDVIYPIGGNSKKLWKRRLAWAADLVFCMRGVGWNIESKKTVIERETMRKNGITRGRFLREQGMTVVGIYLLLDVLKTYVVFDPWFHVDTPAADTLVPRVYMKGLPFSIPFVPGFIQAWTAGVGLMFFRNVLGGLAVYAAVEGESAAIALILVLLRFNEPVEFPRPFGRIHDEKCWSLAGFWGNGWHQSFQRVFTAPVRDKRGLDRLFVPFLMSCILHGAGTYVAGGLGRQAVVFFLMQPFGVVLQNLLVSWLDARTKPTPPPALVERKSPRISSNGKANGHANGKANGHVNGYANGRSPSVANGANGTTRRRNGYTSSSPPLTSTLPKKSPTVTIGNTSSPAKDTVRAVRPSFEISRRKKATYVTLATSLLWLLTVSTRYLEEYVKAGMFDMEPVPISFCRMAGALDGEWVRWFR